MKNGQCKRKREAVEKPLRLPGQKGRPKEQNSRIKELESGRQEIGVRKQDQGLRCKDKEARDLKPGNCPLSSSLALLAIFC